MRLTGFFYIAPGICRLLPRHIFDQPLNVETQLAQLRLSPSSMPPAQFVEQRLQIAGAHCGQIEDPAALSYLPCQFFFRHRIEQAQNCNDPRALVPLRLDRHQTTF
jgi:hypothetical protein